MPRNKKADAERAARARAARHHPQARALSPIEPSINSLSDEEEAIYVETHPSPHHTNTSPTSPPEVDDPFEDSEFEELDGDELLASLCLRNEHEYSLTEKFQSAYEVILKPKLRKDWVAAEKNRGLGYTGLSQRTHQRHEKKVRDEKNLGDELRAKRPGSTIDSFFLRKNKPRLGDHPAASGSQFGFDDNATAHLFTRTTALNAHLNAPAQPISHERPETPAPSIPLDHFTHLQPPPEAARSARFSPHQDVPSASEVLAGLKNLGVMSDQDIHTGFLSDFSDAEQSDPGDINQEHDEEDRSDHDEDLPDSGEPLLQQRKRRRLSNSIANQRAAAKEKRHKEAKLALEDITKTINSKRTKYQAGSKGLQSVRALTIRSLLRMVVENGRTWMEASQIAAESHGFKRDWGSRLARKWTRIWIKHRELPESSKGNHAKTWSVLSDPAVRDEIRSFLRSNKWSMNPKKLAEFTANTLMPAEAKKYAQNLVEKEIPKGLKRYLELELFPRIHFKAKKGISIDTARRIMHVEGFEYSEHKKAVFYDGHERPDVVDYRQNVFIPDIMKLAHRIVRYQVDNTGKMVEVEETPENKALRGDKPRLILTPHDEMTTQANDGPKWSWVLKGEQPLKKKGLGRGMHQSDVICSTNGWLKEASQSMEYGKNYEGYWNGELFVKQLKEKIIPTFEKMYNKDQYRALFFIDNSQGHSAYPDNALRVSEMNFRPGGKKGGKM